jgi:hypothetical protein
MKLLHPGVDLTLGLVLRDSVTLLDAPSELDPLAFDELIAGERGP